MDIDAKFQNLEENKQIKESGGNILFKPKLPQFEENAEVENNAFQQPFDMMNNSRSILTKSSMMTYGKMLCCLCSVTIDANPLGMCTACANSQINILEGITTQALIVYCRTCGRYQRPPWSRLKPESNEMMAFLLSKVKGLKGLKLVDSNFIWTEPHSKQIKIKITLQKEVDKILKQSALVVEFKEEWTQCEDCKKVFTPHTWNACCQIRQKVNHKRTFMYLEQVILKHKMHKKALNIKETPEGVDFFFKNKSHGYAFSDFMQSILPVKVKQAKQLVSHDQWSNLYNYKFTFMIEIAPVCKDDIIILTKEEAKILGGIGPVLLAYKISTNIHLIDPLTMEVIEFDENTYWRHNYRSFIDRSTLEEFVVQNIEIETDYANLNKTITASNVSTKNNHSKSTYHKDVKLNTSSVTGRTSKRENHKFVIARVDCTKVNNLSDDNCKLYSFRTHLGDSLRPGDIALGYDLTSINTALLESCDTTNFPEIILVKKKVVREVKHRVWKLKRMKIDEEAKETDTKNTKYNKNKPNKEEHYEDFLQELEEDKDLRKNVNLYKDDDAIAELQKKFSNLGVEDIIKQETKNFGIAIDEMMEGLKIESEDEHEDLDADEVEEMVNTKIAPKTEFKEPMPLTAKVDLNKPSNTQGKTKSSQLKIKRTRKGSKCVSSSDEK